MTKTFRVLKNIDAYIRQEAYVNANSKEEAAEIADELDNHAWQDVGVQQFDNTLIEPDDAEIVDETLSPENIPEDGYLVNIPATIVVRIKAKSFEDASRIADNLRGLSLNENNVITIQTKEKSDDNINLHGINKADYI